MRAFLDANAGAPPSEAVKGAVAKLLKDNLLNPSGHGELSKALRDRIEDCRAQVASYFGADPIEIVFTSGGSESINTAIASAAAQHQGKVLFSGAEHPATISAVQIHAQGRGLALLVDGNALPKPFDAKGAALVSALWANNEVGSINDVKALDQACGAADVSLHLDAVCAAGKVPINLHALPNLTFASFSAHKFHGLAGAGFLYVRRGTKYQPLIAGGHHERGRRAGTENLIGIVAMAAALEADWDTKRQHMLALQERFEGELASLSGTTIHAQGCERLPNTTSVAFERQVATDLLSKLGEAGVIASAGSACTTGSLEPSHVLRAMGIEDALARATLRFSWHSETSSDEIDMALQVLADATRP